jgi:hypothetical protein
MKGGRPAFAIVFTVLKELKKYALVSHGCLNVISVTPSLAILISDVKLNPHLC